MKLGESMARIWMNIEDGKETQFWEDKWVGNGRLMDRFPHLYSISMQRQKIIS